MISNREARAATWRQRTDAFRDALEAGWRSDRLLPWLFARAGHTERVAGVAVPFSSETLLPTPNFSLEGELRLDGIARQWGADMARGETRAFLTDLASRCVIETPTDRLAHVLYRLMARLGAAGDSMAILTPARTNLLRALEVSVQPVDTAWLPGAAARAWVRGSFEGVPLIIAQDYEATQLWVIDFGRIGIWQHVDALDYLTTGAESLHDRLVEAGNTRTLATRITAESHASVAFDDLAAARGVLVPVES